MNKKEQLEALVQNPAFVEASQNVNSIDELIALYNKFGVDVTADELAGMSRTFKFAKRTEETKAKFKPKSEDKKRNTAVAMVVIMVVGLILFFSGVPKNMRCTEKATGVVISDDEKLARPGSSVNTGNLNSRSYRAIIEYEVGGTVYEGGWGTRMQVRTYHEGEQVALRVNPSKPEEFVDLKYGGFVMANWFGLMMAAIGGIGLLWKKVINR